MVAQITFLGALPHNHAPHDHAPCLALAEPKACSKQFRKAFQPVFGAYQGLARVLKSPSNPQNCRKKEKNLEKATCIFCATNWLKSAFSVLFLRFFRSRPGKPNQKKGQNEKFMNFARFCEFWCFSLGKQARFTSRTFVPECPWEKFMNWPFFGLVCRGHS